MRYVVYSFDASGAITSWRVGDPPLLAWTEAQARGRTLASFAADDLSGHELAALVEDGATHASVEGVHLRDDDGRIVQTAVLVLARPSQEAPGQAVALALETVDERHAQRLTEAAGELAHELNKPLTIIKGYSELLLEDLQPGSPLRSDIEQIKLASERAQVVTSQLGLVGHRRNVEPEVLDVAATLRDLLPHLRSLGGERVSVELIAPEVPVSVRADGAQLAQAFVNVVQNACEACGEGGRIVIDVTRSKHTRDALDPSLKPRAGIVAVTISDNGAGMTSEVRRRALNAFFTTKPSGRGLGLGLSVAQSVMELAGGRLWLSSAPGLGTTVTMEMPAVVGAEVATVELAAPAPPNGVRVLVVEDDAATEQLLVRIFRRAGYEVESASTPSAALGLFRDAAPPFDAVVADVLLPEMSGFALVAEMLRLEPGLTTLFVSGGPDPALASAPPTIRRRLRRGLNLLPKPFSAELLLRSLARLLASASSR